MKTPTDIRFYASGSIRLFVTPSKVSVPAPYTLERDVVDPSDLLKNMTLKVLSIISLT